jgi:hypothetical protein
MHSTSNLKDGYLGSGKKLRYSIRKYGKENFKLEILEFFESRDKLANREKELVNEDLLKDPMCMNLKSGGFGGFIIENAQKGRKSVLEKYNLDTRKEWSKKGGKTTFDRHGVNKKWIDARFSFKGKSHKVETIQKLKQKRKGTGMGSSNSQFGTCWITNEIENKKINKGDIIPDGWRLGRKM